MEIGNVVFIVGIGIVLLFLALMLYYFFIPKAEIQLKNKSLVIIKDPCFSKKKVGDTVRVGYTYLGNKKVYSISQEWDQKSELAIIIEIYKGFSL